MPKAIYGQTKGLHHPLLSLDPSSTLRSHDTWASTTHWQRSKDAVGKKKDLLYICTKQHSPVESLIFIHHFMNFDWKTEKLHFKFLFFFIFSANNLSISLSSFSTVNLSHYFRKANCVTVQPAINPIKTNLQTHYKLSVWTERLSLNRSYHYKSMWPESHLSSHPCPQIQRSILLFKFH